MDFKPVKAAVSAVGSGKYSPSHVATLRKAGNFMAANKGHAWHKSSALRSAMKKTQTVRNNVVSGAEDFFGLTEIEKEELKKKVIDRYSKLQSKGIVKPGVDRLVRFKPRAKQEPQVLRDKITRKMYTGNSEASDAEVRKSAETVARVFDAPPVSKQDVKAKIKDVVQQRFGVNFGGHRKPIKEGLFLFGGVGQRLRSPYGPKYGRGQRMRPKFPPRILSPQNQKKIALPISVRLKAMSALKKQTRFPDKPTAAPAVPVRLREGATRAKGIDAHANKLAKQDADSQMRAIRAHPKATRLYNKYRTEKHTMARLRRGMTASYAVGGAIGGAMVGSMTGVNPVKTGAIFGAAYGGGAYLGARAGEFLGKTANRAVMKRLKPKVRAKIKRDTQKSYDVQARKLADPKRLVNRARFKFMREDIGTRAAEVVSKAKGMFGAAKKFATNPYAGEMLRRKILTQDPKSIAYQRVGGVAAGVAYNALKSGHYKRKYNKIKGKSAGAKKARTVLAKKYEKNRKRIGLHVGVGGAVPGAVYAGALLSTPGARDSVKTGVRLAKNQTAATILKHVGPIRKGWQSKIRQGNVGKAGFDLHGIKIIKRKGPRPAVGSLLRAKNEDIMTREELINKIFEQNAPGGWPSQTPSAPSTPTPAPVTTSKSYYTKGKKKGDKTSWNRSYKPDTASLKGRIIDYHQSRRSGTGAAIGTAVGAIGGMATGAAAGYGLGKALGKHSMGATEVGTLAGGMAGGIAGSIGGGAVGHKIGFKSGTKRGKAVTRMIPQRAGAVRKLQTNEPGEAKRWFPKQGDEAKKHKKMFYHKDYSTKTHHTTASVQDGRINVKQSTSRGTSRRKGSVKTGFAKHGFYREDVIDALVRT